jgi:hypothetical protein
MAIDTKARERGSLEYDIGVWRRKGVKLVALCAVLQLSILQLPRKASSYE